MSIRQEKLINKMIAIEKNKTLNFSEQLIEKYKLLSVMLSDEGWYPDYGLAQKTLSELYLSQILNNTIALDTFMMDFYKKKLNRIIKYFEEKFENRFIILKKAFKAHKKGDYELSIPVFLSQIEGIFYDLTQKNIFSKNKRYKEASAQKWVESKIGKIDNFRIALLEPLKENQNISSNFKESTNYPKVLNRNMILHGRDLKYSNEINSFKAISLLLFIGTITYDSENDPGEINWI